MAGTEVHPAQIPSGEDAGAFANQTAFWALVIAAVLGVLKFLKEYREL